MLEPNPTLTRTHRSLVVALLAAAAVLVVVGGLVLLNRDDGSEQSPVGDTVGSATTSVPVPSDADIAEAGLVDNDHIGGGYRQVAGATVDRDPVDGPGATSPLCAAFLDTVFENPAHVRPPSRARASRRRAHSWSRSSQSSPTSRSAVRDDDGSVRTSLSRLHGGHGHRRLPSRPTLRRSPAVRRSRRYLRGRCDRWVTRWQWSPSPDRSWSTTPPTSTKV